MTTLVNISDIHCGKGWMYKKENVDRAIELINNMEHDGILVTGDLTDWGLRFEFEMAVEVLDRLEGEKYIVPGNHDARHEGFKIFQELIGPRHFTVELDDILLVGMDSTSPDLDTGHIGREQRSWMEEKINSSSRMPLVFLHHHSLPVPDTGRERNVLVDAPGFIGDLDRLGVPLVVNGHKHVPWVWRLNNTVVSTTGTLSCERTNYGQSFNIYSIEGCDLTIDRVSLPDGQKTRIWEGKLCWEE